MMMMDILRLKKEAGTDMLYIQLHIMQRRRALSGSSPQNVSLKKFLVFFPKKNPLLKNFLYFIKKTFFLYFRKSDFLVLR